MKKFYTVAFLLGVFVLVGSLANAAPSSSPISGNPNKLITQLSIDQAKNGSIGVTKMLVGDLSTNTPTLAKFTSTGLLGVMLPSSANPSEALDVNGSIRLSDLNIPNRSVCADKDGTFINCGFAEYKYTGNSTTSTETFTVPSGITSLTVELWGAGGSGYGAYNSAEHSPDDYAYCISAGDYYCISGGSTFFYDKNNSSTVLFQAKGGKGPTSSTTGGGGGSTYVKSGITATTTTNGAQGGAGSSGASTTNGSITCSGTTQTTKKPGAGGNGGTGGKSGDGFSTPGGLGGLAGIALTSFSTTALKCADYDDGSTPRRGLGFLGDNGFTGIYGAGGSGGGGRGGDADLDKNNTCATNVFGGNTVSCASAASGYAGGGGGGYIKATISVTPGDTYNIKLSHGGVPQGRVETTGCFLNAHWGGTCDVGSMSGEGSPGYARLSW